MRIGILAVGCVIASAAIRVAVGCVSLDGLSGGTDVGDSSTDARTDADILDPKLRDASCGDLMTDPANCGACGRSCLGAPCSAGRCPVTQLTAETEDIPNFLALDNANVYFTQGGPDASVRVVAKDGDGGARDLSALHFCFPKGVAADDGRVYVAALESGCGAGLVAGFPKDGGAPSQLGATKPIGVAAANGAPYFTDVGSGQAGAGIVATGSTAPATVLERGLSFPYALALDSTSIYWTELGDPPYDAGVVRRAPLAGDADSGTILATGLSTPGGVAVGATLYVSDLARGILSVPRGGGAPSVLVPLPNVFRVTTDGLHLYFTTQGGTDVYRARLDGSEVMVLAQDQRIPFDITVDATHVYWTNEGSFSGGNFVPGTGSIARTPK